MSALLTTGLDKNGELVNIEDVAYGKKCDCICYICGNPLIAKNKVPLDIAKRAHHFAHHPGCKCEAADETILHQLAKDIICEEKTLMLPKTAKGDKPSGLVRFRSVEKEKWDEEYKIKPDIDAITENGERIMIEFYVSHHIPSKKRNIIVKNNLNCIEVDLNYVALDKKAIRSFLMENADDRVWIGPIYNERRESEGGLSFYSRNPWHDKAIDFLKEQFSKGTLCIGENKIYNLRDYAYDVCEPSKMYRKFSLDLLLSRSKKEDKGFIALSIRGRRRNEKHRTPRNLRVIDIVIRNEEDYKRLVEKNNLCCEDRFIIYEGFNFK